MSRVELTFRVRRNKYQEGNRGLTEAKRHLDSESQGKKESTLRGTENNEKLNKNKK